MNIEVRCWYPQTPNISRTLEGDKTVDPSDVVGALPFDVLKLHLHYSWNTWLQWIGPRQLQDKMTYIEVWGFVGSYIKGLKLCDTLLAQIPQCMRPITHNGPFHNRNAHVCTFLLQMVHRAIWHRCIVGFLDGFMQCILNNWKLYLIIENYLLVDDFPRNLDEGLFRFLKLASYWYFVNFCRAWEIGGNRCRALVERYGFTLEILWAPSLPLDFLRLAQPLHNWL